MLPPTVMTARAVLVAAAALPAAIAQAPPAWATLTLPQPVDPGALDGQGKLVVYREAAAVHVFSAVTRRWHTTPIGAGAALQLFNDVLLVREPGTWRAFASYRGAFADLPVSPAAVLLNPGSQQNDSIVLVADAGQLHAFSGLTGAWVSRPVGAAFGAAVQRHTALLADGAVLAGMDAFSGQWHDHPVAAPVTWLSADGMAGLAAGGGFVHGFAAASGTWQSAPQPGGATFVRGDDWGMWYGNGGALAFSGLGGGFATSADPASGVWTTQDLFAMLDGPRGLTAYSAVTGEFALPVAAPVQLHPDLAVAVLHDVLGARGYSALTNRCVRLAYLVGSIDTSAGLAYANEVGGGRAHLFSALTGVWHAAPPDAAFGPPLLTTTAAALTAPHGGYGFAAHDGSFAPLGFVPLGFRGNGSSAPLCAFDASQLAAFDPRIARWRTTPRPGTGPVQFAIWRTSALVADGTTAFGFGAQAGAWHAFVVGQTGAALSANSEVAFLAINDTVSACSMLPEVLPFAQFPEFRRVQPLGAPLRLSVALQAPAVAVLAVGPLGAGPTPVPAIGELWPSLGASALTTLVTPPSGEPIRLSWPLPNAPALAGVPLAMQAFVLPAVGAAYLTELATVRPW